METYVHSLCTDCRCQRSMTSRPLKSPAHHVPLPSPRPSPPHHRRHHSATFLFLEAQYALPPPPSPGLQITERRVDLRSDAFHQLNVCHVPPAQKKTPGQHTCQKILFLFLMQIITKKILLELKREDSRHTYEDHERFL